MSRSDQILTTGDVARICKVAPRTVSKWFDTGRLRGYRIPGSKDRRIPLNQLIRFMKVYGLPLGDLETSGQRVLIVDADAELTSLIEQALCAGGEYDVRTAGSAFEAGAVVAGFQPHVVVVSVDLPGMDARTLMRFFAGHAELQGTAIIGTCPGFTEADRQELLQRGFRDLLAKPFTIRQLKEALSAVHAPH